VLQSVYGPTARFPRIVRIPIFHNSVDDGSVSVGYTANARYLARKYSYLPTIATGRFDIKNDDTMREPTLAASSG
jgi:hypothetical protein